jgi:hypothetical protein
MDRATWCFRKLIWHRYYLQQDTKQVPRNCVKTSGNSCAIVFSRTAVERKGFPGGRASATGVMRPPFVGVA